MPIPASAVGAVFSETIKTYIDTRWILSYAAGIGDHNPAYLDTTRGGEARRRPTNDFHGSGLQGTGLVAHPVFVWAVEWPVMWTRVGEILKPRAGERGLLPGERGAS